MAEKLDKFLELVKSSKKTVAITGAGISYLYGVGRLKKMVDRQSMMGILSPEYVKANPDKFYEVVNEAFLDATFGKGPSKVHTQLRELEKKGRLHGIITNNMDCLHQAAGSASVVEIQGGFDDNICVSCGMRVYDYKVWGGGKAPRCPGCGAPLMPANFCRTSASHDAEFSARMEKAADMLSDADLIVIIGTTGFLSENYMTRVNPKAVLVQINPGSTKFDAVADMNIREDAAKVLDFVLENL
ncbi:MAG: hypothetical protein LUD29_05195 [Clostridia bacterium]|nr:hypothetical protein [Clostridia bacterium]